MTYLFHVSRRSAAPILLQSMTLAASQLRWSSHSGIQKKKDTRLRVIVTKSGEGVGEEGEERLVRRGYARNYLFPRKLAVYWTPESKKAFEEAASRIDYAGRARAAAFDKAQRRLSKITVLVKRAKVSERPIVPVDVPTIARQLWRQFQIEVPLDKIVVEGGGLQSFGTHTIGIAVGSQGDLGQLRVQVIPR